MRTGIEISVTPEDRKTLEALIASRNTPAKVVWRAEIILATSDGCGTNEVMRRTGKSKTCPPSIATGNDAGARPAAPPLGPVIPGSRPCHHHKHRR